MKASRFVPCCLAAAAALVVSASGAVQSVVVIMSGLNEPRDVSVAPNGDIYVVEAGFDPAVYLSPIATDTGEAFFGNTGSYSRLSGGVASRPVSGLPMLYNPVSNEVTGAHGIIATDSGVILSIGLGATEANRALGPAGSSALGSIFHPYSSNQTDVAALTVTSSNPFHIAASSNGIVIADAADNSVMSLENGVLTRVGFIPDLAGGTDFVPTGVAVNETGGIYVGGLSGFPFTPGSASIYLMDGGLTSLFASGFTNIVDIAMGPAGSLYVLEYATNGIMSGNSTGGLWSLSADGSTKEMLLSDGLVHPTGLTTGPDGTVYVTHNGGSIGSGELLAITIPEPSSLALAFIAGAALLGQRRRK